MSDTQAEPLRRRMLEPRKDELRSVIAVLRSEKATAEDRAQLEQTQRIQSDRLLRVVLLATPACMVLAFILGYAVGKLA